jgi:hypothetical protein
LRAFASSVSVDPLPQKFRKSPLPMVRAPELKEYSLVVLRPCCRGFRGQRECRYRYNPAFPPQFF